VQSAAYITGERLHESRRDLDVNYQNRHSDIAFTATLAPEYAPEMFHDVRVWDHFENFEDEYGYKHYKTDATRDAYLSSARSAQTIVVALPRELEIGITKELVEEFAKTRFVSRGLVVTYAIHDDEGNPHAHYQISLRSVDEKGQLSWSKDRGITAPKSIRETRKIWADLTNHYLEREGLDTRITEKSFAALGIHLESTQHRGWVADKLESMGIKSRIVVENAAVFENNRDLLLETPSTILPELTQNNATFTQMNLLKAVSKRVGDDAPLVAQVFEKALQESIVVGEGVDGQIRYTSPTYKALEENAVSMVSELSAASFEQPHLTKMTTESYLSTHFAHLSPEQQAAVTGLTQEQSLAVLVGRAGSGKTTTLKAVSDIYKDAGHPVIGASLSAMAADNLGREAGITSATLHSWIYQWERYQAAQDKFLSFDSVMEEGVFKQLDWYQDLKRFEKIALTKDTVLIVDEAGMVGTRLWGELLTHVNRAGAKLIAVGDDNQFKAIEAGDFFREIQTHAQNYSLNTIYRQKQEWMKDASQNLANLEVGEALSAYEQRGHVHQTSKDNLAHEIATAYVAASQKENDGQTSIVLAFTNAQTHEINQAIRGQLKQEGLLSKHDIITMNDNHFAIGDRIVFLENDKTRLVITDEDGVVQKGTYIKNGTQGRIQGVNKQGDIQVQLGDNLITTIKCLEATTAKVAIGQPEPEASRTYAYARIAHGYAVTTHKAQGQTVDNVFVAAAKNMDAKGIYVAMTRHRHDVQLFYAKEDFSTFKALSSHLSRFEHKDLVKDYTIRPENEAAWQRVQEYRLCVLDGAAILKEQGKNNQNPGQVDWEAYRQIKQDQISIGREILEDFDAHKLYINQAGLTNEMLQITTGLRARPLSNAEEKAKLTVELYGETAQVARDLWRDIRKTNPGAQCYHHPKYEQFKELRDERNSLAHTIGENYGLHREFVSEFARVYSINKRTVEAQSNQFIQQQRELKQQQETHSTDHNIVEKQDKLWYNNRLDNLSYGKYSTSTLNSTLEYSKISLDPALIKQELNSRIKDLAHQFLGQPQQQKATEWRYGSKGSISIHVAGSKQGLYSNFESGESGNALKFIQDQLECDHRHAFKWGAEWLGQDRLGTFTRTPMGKDQPQPQAKQEWTPLFPAPATPVDIKAEKSLGYMLKGKIEVARYAYKDADSNVLGYVVRLEDKSSHKITPTLTYCQNDRGEKQWRWQGFGNDRPLYGLDQLKAQPNAPVLIVEGEKTCEAARELFKDHAVVTWSGGSGAVQKSDWSTLKDRSVTIWPDHDQPGLNAAAKITAILENQGNQEGKTVEVKIVNLPSTLPHKWDLADKAPDGLDVRDILERAVIKEPSPLVYSKAGSGVDQSTVEKNENILTYLKAELTLDRNFWLDEKQIDYFTKLAHENPQNALQKWQYVSEDDSFRPLTRQETESMELQANQHLAAAKEVLSSDAYQRLQMALPSHAEGIVDKCQEALYANAQMQRDLDISTFKSLCEKYGEVCERNEGSESRKLIEKDLKELVSHYENDAKFMKTIERSDNKNVQNVVELFKNEDLSKEQTEPSRGFER
jgi:ATP-dependent exoDNAse (exonuclease V) alpha subunit